MAAIHQNPKPTIYDQENPSSYVQPLLPVGKPENVVNFPDRKGDTLDEEGVMFGKDVWKRFTPGERALIYAISATMVAAVAASANKATLGEGMVSIFHEGEHLLGINNNQSSKDSLKTFTSSDGKKINITSA